MRNILITGGSRGIGEEAVRHFMGCNDNVVFTYKDSYEQAKQLMEETGSYGFRCDISSEEQIKDMTKDALVLLNNKVDVLILNAAIPSYGDTCNMSNSHWKNVIDTNLNGSYYTIRELIPNMISNKRGKIITVSSIWGEVGASCEVAYSSAKAGIIGMTKALAKELAPSNINVNCISPGLIDTDMNKIFTGEEKIEMIDNIPLGRLGYKKEVVDAMEFLGSDRASYITGQIIGINGGLVI